MTIAITGATGQLGTLVVSHLLRSVPASELVLAVRSPEKATAFAEQGVAVRRADYDEPDTLAPALAGVDKLLLISGNAVGQRIAQHTAVVEAAAATGVRHIAYTSVLYADTTPLILAPEHKATEQVIRDSGIPFTFLRNGWYTENYAQLVTDAVRTGEVLTCAGDGRVASAARADYAEAAAIIMADSGHENTVYELSGDTAWTFTEFAATIARLTGKEIVARNVSGAEYQRILTEAGVPEAAAGFAAALNADIARGELAHTPGQLSNLLGRPTTPLADSVSAMLPD